MNAWPDPRARLAMLFAMYLVRALAGVWAFLPLAEAALPPLDVLLQPGGLYLLEALRIGRQAWLEAAPRLVLAVAFASFLGLWPTAAWLYAHCLSAKPRLAHFLATSFRFFGSLAFLGVIALVAYLALGLLTLLVLLALPAWFAAPVALPLAFAVAACALFAFALFGIAHDLARAHLVRHDARALPSLVAGLCALGVRPIVAWGWRVGCGVALMALSGWLSVALGTETTAGLVAVVLVQNLALFGLVALRASFLRAVLRFV